MSSLPNPGNPSLSSGGREGGCGNRETTPSLGLTSNAIPLSTKALEILGAGREEQIVREGKALDVLGAREAVARSEEEKRAQRKKETKDNLRGLGLI